MAVPKYKKSKSRTRSRRAHYLRMTLPSLSVCPNCGNYKLPHRVCPYCGYYKGKGVIKIREKKKGEAPQGE